MNEAVLFPVRLSLQVAATATAVLVAVTVPLAYAFARGRFPGRRLLEVLFSLPLVLPPTVLGYYLVALVGRRGLVGRWLYETTGWTPVFSWWGAVLASAVVAFPLLFHTAVAAIAAVDPRLEQAAFTLGHSRWRTFWRVTLPLARRGLLAGVVLAFARAMGEFGATLMVAGNIPGRTTTMPVAIYNAFISGRMATAGTLVLIHTGVALFFLWLVRGARGSEAPA
ncbi:molybdate ABC transporter permease subunit [Dissulfurirhabdus thermomarina]|uniref:Molybdenum transport system permease n=1 Tax=Dissulfurirhabdus thermomarina TaxID=1765737 RepID=A0A6N9TMH3_DISTH|nr:molybdate ABC transporter permease subunit [Dissulfurirhabdus thermomarina]NDY42491.1 molybdate ABC transporter permease subunit [Dissulfurirhabdus thermomarina]NMX22872.1 molybdate ABC transporter permease subunit [Dissulfurirhabdus thermomarina]